MRMTASPSVPDRPLVDRPAAGAAGGLGHVDHEERVGAGAGHHHHHHHHHYYHHHRHHLVLLAAVGSWVRSLLPRCSSLITSSALPVATSDSPATCGNTNVTASVAT